MEKFHHFLYASYFILETGQKPLEVILSKSLNQATPRLQQILIRTFAYHFTVRYILVITNQFADCLSHLGGQKDSIKLPKLQVHQITSHLNARSDSSQEIRIVTQEDDQAALLKHTITHGWPNAIWEVPSKTPTILDLLGGAYSWRWDCLERHMYWLSLARNAKLFLTFYMKGI